MSMLNSEYAQGHNVSGNTIGENENLQTQQDAQMMHYQNYQNYQNPPMHFDPSTLQTMAQSGMFNMSGMQVGNETVPMPTAPPPLAPQFNKQQSPGNTIQNFSQHVTSAEGNSKRSKKKSQGEGTPAKKLKSNERVTLFVGCLHPDANEEAIWNYFEDKEISLFGVRKKVGKMFCHVDLADPDDLPSALALNGEFFMGLAIRLEKATIAANGLSTEGKDTKTLFVANLADTVTEKMLKDVFPDCLEVRYPMDKSGAHSGYAFLKYDDEVKVKELIEEFQGFQLEGNSMILDYAAEKTSYQKTGPKFEKDETSLFIGNMTDHTSLDDIWDIFPNATEVRNPNDGRKSYCFVRFDSSDEAKVAKDKNRGAIVNGRRIIIDFADKTRKEPEGFGAESGNTNILVVKNLSFKTNEDRLRQEFPEVSSIRMVYFAGTQRPKGYAFLEFETSDVANDVYDEINEVGRTVNGRVLVAEFAVQKGSRAFKARGKKIEEKRKNECKQRSMWGPHGMAYEGVEMPSNFAYGSFGLDTSSEILDKSKARGYGEQEIGANSNWYDDQDHTGYSRLGKARGGYHTSSEGFIRGRGGNQSNYAYRWAVENHKAGRDYGGYYSENYSENFVERSSGKQFEGSYRCRGRGYGGYNDKNSDRYGGMMANHRGRGGKAIRGEYDNVSGYGGWNHGHNFSSLENSDCSQDNNGLNWRGGKGNISRDQYSYGGRKPKNQTNWSFKNPEVDGTELPFSFTGRTGRK